jgi:hypothetical protein
MPEKYESLFAFRYYVASPKPQGSAKPDRDRLTFAKVESLLARSEKRKAKSEERRANGDADG